MAGRQLSRSASGLRHAVGDDEAAPAPQEKALGNVCSVQPLTMEMMDALQRVHNEGFGSKVCCLCFPIADTDGRIRRFYDKHPERLPMCGVAHGSDGTPLGYIQLAIYPMNDKDGLHPTKPGEAYIEQISVAADARGKGVGYELLRWAESRAREHHSRFLTLTVLNGNPARRLYERFGFQPKPTDCCEDCIVGLFVVCFFGRPYGLCNPHYGITEMHKSLTR